MKKKPNTKKPAQKQASATWSEPPVKQKTKIAEIVISFFEDDSFTEEFRKWSDRPILSTTLIGAVEIINIRRAMETLNNEAK